MSSPAAPHERESFLTASFKLILAITFLAFGMEAIVRVLVPLIILDHGGDAVTVGIVATAYALPSLLFRPIVGSLVDGRQHRILYRGGMFFATLIPTLLLLPGIATMTVVRFLNGTAWSFFSVSNHSLMARLSPPNRRAEASGVFMTMPALGQLILPGLGVALYTATGHEAFPILLAVTLGLGALVLVIRMPVPVPPTPPTPAGSAEERISLFRRFVEPSALPATAMLVTSYSAVSVFAVFAPVYAQHVGSPVEVLVLYFPILGLAQAISQPVFGRLADRLGRARSIAAGCLVAASALLIALIPGFVTFTIAAFVYALSQSLVNPTISALVIERAPRHRLGSAMATWSIGFQFAIGTSSLLWGALITSVGFTGVFLVAAGLQVVTIVMSRRIFRSPSAPRAAPAA